MKIEKRKEGESMKTFKKRIRQLTRLVSPFPPLPPSLAPPLNICPPSPPLDIFPPFLPS